jgi:alpha-N-arabinofuranosidase
VLPIESLTAIKPGSEVRTTPCADGSGPCLGWTRPDDWITFAKVDLGKPQTLSIDAGALGHGGIIEFYSDLGTPEAERLGSMTIPHTGDWQKWQRFSAPLSASSFGGERTLALLFKAGTASLIPGTDTTLWAQFKGINPNEANVEINVRQSVFYPSKPGVNFITVRGFELRQAATPWAGAMSEQIGLIGTHWSKGWIIENNHIHHSIATGVTLGRYELRRQEFPPATAPGFVKSIELALRDGWSKEKIGSHIVRSNHISHCEKNAIHGSLGSPFCEISGNEIHDIANRGWIAGPDTGGIKFLGGVDMMIRDNHIHHCGGAAGIWLDWMAQGTQVTGNLLHDNGQDIFFEMQHGPLLSANNILLSAKSQLINSEGLALAHNLIAGATHNISDPRATPFHPAHALTIAGLYAACGGGHRVHNNIFAGGWNMLGKLPNIASGNLFIGSAKPLPFDPAPVVKTGFDPQLKITRKDDGWHLSFNADPAWRAAAKCGLVTTALLGKATISNCAYENTDGTPLRVDTDYFGKPRNPQNPFPGPFEITKAGKQEIKVWPKQ